MRKTGISEVTFVKVGVRRGPGAPCSHGALSPRFLRNAKGPIELHRI